MITVIQNLRRSLLLEMSARVLKFEFRSAMRKGKSKNNSNNKQGIQQALLLWYSILNRAATSKE